MPYPGELLPKPNYKGKIEVEVMLGQHPNVSLVRRSRPITDISELGFRDVFPSRSDLFGFSTFVYGQYKREHVKYNTANPPYWNEGDTCLSPGQIEFFEENKGPLFLPLSHCHKMQVPLLKKKDSQITQTVRTTILVQHRPTIHNYWHFEFTIMDESGKVIPREEAEDTKWIKRSAEEFAEAHIMNLIDHKDKAEVALNANLYLVPEAAA
jgi:hypothetical protein